MMIGLKKLGLVRGARHKVLTFFGASCWGFLLSQLAAQRLAGRAEPKSEL